MKENLWISSCPKRIEVPSFYNKNLALYYFYYLVKNLTKLSNEVRQFQEFFLMSKGHQNVCATPIVLGECLKI